MNSVKFGIFVSDILNEKELTESQKEAVILHSLDEIEFSNKRSLTEMLGKLDELDYGHFGELSAHMLFQKELLNRVLDRNISLQDELSSLQPKKRSRHVLNEPNSFHDGRPCVKCNTLADHCNKKGIKIALPRQHPYGRCPLYCNICAKDYHACQDHESHLSYSCEKCRTDYSNHPTNKCSNK